MKHVPTLTVQVVAAACMTMTVECVLAGVTQVCGVVSCAGGWVTTADAGTFYTVAQSACADVSAGSLHLYAGLPAITFLQPATIGAHPLPCEADPDNDGDGLSDLSEITGTAFAGHATTNPNSADTDGDGMTDDAEAAGMYDPDDPEHRLAIVSFRITGGVAKLTWIGRGGGTTNTILRTGGLRDGWTGPPVVTTTSEQGDPPWYKLTHSYSWSVSANTNAFYKVRTSR